MKKLCHIVLATLLSVTILFIGSGVSFMRCAHTGTVKMMTAMSVGGMGDMGCNTNSSCMSVERVELSPVDVAPGFDYDFHAVQPLIAVLPSLVALWTDSGESKAKFIYDHQAWSSPPRDYLSFIRVLLI